MDRKEFLKKGIIGLSTAIAAPSLITSCKKEEPNLDPYACVKSPTETGGPFIIKTPADLVRDNIIGDRTGVALLVNIKVEDVNNSCEVVEGALVDLWHCDAHGNYSEYTDQVDGDFTNQSFLRGRQTTNANGIASFITIYPGWYPGRAPHLHIEILKSDGTSLLVTQTAFPEDISKEVYATSNYKGDFDTANANDISFMNTLDLNMAVSVIGNTKDGYTLEQTIKVEL